MPKLTYRTLLIAKRDYITSIRSKAFLIGLIIFPLLFGGGLFGVAIMKAKPDLRDRHVALIDRTHKVTSYVAAAAARKNEKSSHDPKTGLQIAPRYFVDATPVEPGDPNEQRLALSGRVKRGEIFAFVDLGPDVLHPPEPPPGKEPKGEAGFYADSGKMDAAENWITGAINDGVRTARLAEAGIDAARSPDLLKGINVDTMHLVVRDPKTGAIHEPEKEDQIAAFLIPFATMMLLLMIVMIGAAPMMSAVTEDKSQRIVEMLLGIATPLDLMAGKVIAGVARSLTSSVLYVTVATIALLGLNVAGVAPLTVLPWFYVYLLAQVTMLCALSAGLGAACNTPQEAANLVMIVIAPLMIPMFILVPLINKPNGAFATVMSLLPPFTPSVMLLRQMMPGGVPAWQPWVGLAGVVVFAAFGIWVSSRVFRVAILMQGQPLRLKELVRWAVRG